MHSVATTHNPVFEPAEDKELPKDIFSEGHKTSMK